MGISDKDYADALIKQRAYEAQQTKEKQMLGAAISSIGIPPGLTTTGALHYPNQQTSIGIKPLREEDLKHDAMKAPLSALVDMWTMRWDNQWVNEQEFMDDDFWRLALLRLLGANKLEKHNLVNQYHAVYRIIE
jgi:hypothetical protein